MKGAFIQLFRNLLLHAVSAIESRILQSYVPVERNPLKSNLKCSIPSDLGFSLPQVRQGPVF